METIIKITILGTGTPILNLGREGPSVALEVNENVYIFDAGRSIGKGRIKHKLRLKK